LRARPAPEGKIEDQEYFVLEPNAWLDGLGNMTFAALLQVNPTQVPAHSGSRALRFFDDQTLILADVAPMKQFLTFKGRFPPKPQPKEAATDAANPEGGEAGRPGGAVVPRGRGAPPPAETGTPEGENAPPPPSSSYVTINPNLKYMLDLVERKQPVVSLAVDTKAARSRLSSFGLGTLEGVLDTGTLTKLAIKTILEEVGIFGASVQLRDGLAVTLAEDCQNEDIARRRYATLRRETGPELAKVLTTAFGTRVEMEDDPNADNPASSPDQPTPGPINPGLLPGGRMAPPAGRPGAVGGSGMGRPGGPGFPGGPMSGMGPRGNVPQTPAEPEKPKPGSTIKLEGPEKTVVLLTVSLTDAGANNRLMQGKIRELVLQEKGHLDMAGSHLGVHDLGDAVRRYAEAHQAQFPPGTLERPIPTSRAGRPYEPKQRISWMAELLPYLGPEQASLYRGIDRKKSWNDTENHAAAATLVPQFLMPNYPQNTWWIRYPGMAQSAAATHFVGIAGIGADAAEYAANDPAAEKKLGVFGYDRATRLQDITDGVSQTILMAQVPPTYKRPWMAGGGSTVQGVLEKDSVRPFVSPQPDGKRGTLVVMADGSVRFIAENIKDDVFKALCTTKGGETGIILDRDAPPVPRPEPEAELAPPPTPPSAPASVASPSTGGWKEFTSKQGGFTVAFPAVPQETNISQKSPQGNVEVHLAMCTMPADQGHYQVTYTDLSEALLKQLGVADAARMLDNLPQQTKTLLPGAKPPGEMKKITLNGNPGREFTLELPGKGPVLFRVYVVKNRVYQLMAMSAKDPASSPDVQRFFDSFKLIDN
ncbi:MAG TPA: DUF1559 domain-containing protein, partial [Gemmataceae bacterium]|nr:DUF1559 domain-containing protein [Gemmataceae bacterium]